MSHVSDTSFQGWMTPRPIAAQLVAEFNVVLDCAAAHHNAVVNAYFDGSEHFLDGLKAPWDVTADSSAYCNPPYENVPAWLAKAEAEVESGRCNRALLLVPFSAGVVWMTSALVRHEVHIFDSRIKFDLPPDEYLPEDYRDGRKRRSPGGGNALVVIQQDGLRGLTAIRSSETGEIVFDFLELPVSRRGFFDQKAKVAS